MYKLVLHYKQNIVPMSHVKYQSNSTMSLHGKAIIEKVLWPGWYTASVQTVHYACLRRICSTVLCTKPGLQQYRSLGQQAGIPHPPSGQGEKGGSWLAKLSSKCDRKITTFAFDTLCCSLAWCATPDQELRTDPTKLMMYVLAHPNWVGDQSE